MNQERDAFGQFFGVVAKKQTYVNLLYLVLAFPLGLAYFVLLVVGLSVGIGTLIIGVGILILLLTFAGAWLTAMFERQLAISMLHVDIPAVSPPAPETQTAWERAKAYFASPVAWKSLAYLFVKFPLGILSFTLVVTAVSATLALLFAPLALPWLQSYDVYLLGPWKVDTMSEALAAMMLAFLVGPALLHATNWLAWVSGRFARVMLGAWPRPAVPGVPQPPEPPSEPEPPQAA